MDDFNTYVGMDVHMESVTVAIAHKGRSDPMLWGEVVNRPLDIRRMAKRLKGKYGSVAFCYEAGPCGYEIYRDMASLGHTCIVAAPSLVPRKPGERIKTDRRDALKLAREFRSGNLTSVWVPDREQEAIRDLVRARADMKATDRRFRQRLNAFLLRNGRIFPGRSKWTPTHLNWLAEQKFDLPAQQIVFQEYVDATVQAQTRVAGMEAEIRKTVQAWAMEPVVTALTALRGISDLAAAIIVAEIGDITRFDSAPQLMSYIGLVPSEFSSGGPKCKRRGGITKTGNNHVRRTLVESGWTYRFPARKTAHLERRAKKSPEAVQAIAWKAQKRLCGRFRHLVLKRNKLPVEATTAIARELLGFIWAIAREVQPRGVPSAVGPC
jgi:transposase